MPSIFCPAPGLPSPQLQRKELRETRKAQALSRSKEENTDAKERLYFETEIEVQNTYEISSAGAEKDYETVEVTTCSALDGQSEVDGQSEEEVFFLNSSSVFNLDDTFDSDDDVEFFESRPTPKPPKNDVLETEDQLNHLIFNQHFYSKPYISIDKIRFSTDDCLHYTGLVNFDRFLTVFHSLGPNVHCLRSHFRDQSIDSVQPETAFLLMLVYLRCHYPTTELGRMFCLSEFTVRNVVYTWIKFCAHQWREVNFWPEKETVDLFCPRDFQLKYKGTRTIVDGTEIPIQKPKNPTAQRASFSTYKNRNTIKVLVGATPGGLVSYVSDA